MFGAGSRIRTYEGECQQIYSLSCLTASLSQRTFREIAMIFATKLLMEPIVRLELTTCCLQNSCSTTELNRQKLANNYILSVGKLQTFRENISRTSELSY